METKKIIEARDKKYLSQRQLANRWLCASSTIKSMRDQGELPFFQPPASIKILYPLDQIVLIENNNNESQRHQVTKTQGTHQISNM